MLGRLRATWINSGTLPLPSFNHERHGDSFLRAFSFLPQETSGYRAWVDGRVECAVMETHAPHHPTTGILIALSLEGTLEWWHANTYDLQALYARMQDGIERDVFAAAMLGSSIPGKPTPSEIEDTKRQLRLALGGIIILENIAKKLNELYSTALKDAP